VSLPIFAARRPYGWAVTAAADYPIFSTMVTDLLDARALAERRVDELDQLLAEVEALHEPNSDGDCPTCLTEAPCVTFGLLHRDLTFERACVTVRTREPIDLIAAEWPDRPAVPSLAALLATPNPAMDRAFAALISPRPTLEPGD
jgi:hypothetical protein